MFSLIFWAVLYRKSSTTRACVLLRSTTCVHHYDAVENIEKVPINSRSQIGQKTRKTYYHAGVSKIGTHAEVDVDFGPKLADIGKRVLWVVPFKTVVSACFWVFCQNRVFKIGSIFWRSRTGFGVRTLFWWTLQNVFRHLVKDLTNFTIRKLKIVCRRTSWPAVRIRCRTSPKYF